MVRRVGTFFLLVGILIIFISFGSDERDSQAIQIFCVGLTCALVGLVIWYRTREPSQSSRFRLIKKIASRDKE